jgi:hypothetical protein
LTSTKLKFFNLVFADLPPHSKGQLHMNKFRQLPHVFLVAARKPICPLGQIRAQQSAARVFTRPRVIPRQISKKGRF